MLSLPGGDDVDERLQATPGELPIGAGPCGSLPPVGTSPMPGAPPKERPWEQSPLVIEAVSGWFVVGSMFSKHGVLG